MSNAVQSWLAGVGLAGGAAVTAAVIAAVGAPAAHADDTPEDVMAQAVSDLNQGAVLLDAAPTADLSAKQADTLADAVNLNQELEPVLTQIGAAQEGLSAGDQNFLATVDEQFVSAAQNVLSADQAFVAADQAGDLSGSSFNSADLTLLDSALGLLSADFNVGGATLFAFFDPDIDSLGAAAASATADTSAGDLLSQAGQDLTQAISALGSAPTTSLDSADLQLLNDQLGFLPATPESFLTQAEAIQAGLPAADQTSPLLLAADQQLLQGFDAVLSADQAFLAADQAGELTAQTAAQAPGLAAEMGVVDATWGLIPGTLDVGVTDIVAQLAADVGLSF